MAGKQLMFSDDARQKILSGVQKLPIHPVGEVTRPSTFQPSLPAVGVLAVTHNGMADMSQMDTDRVSTTGMEPDP